MRKFAAVGCAVLALGAIWTGTAWYTGKQLETGMAQLADSADQLARQIGVKTGEPLSFEPLSYERGVFTSQARYRLKTGPSPEDGAAAAGHEYEMVVRLDHGPFPCTAWRGGTCSRPWRPCGPTWRRRLRSTPGSRLPGAPCP